MLQQSRSKFKQQTNVSGFHSRECRPRWQAILACDEGSSWAHLRTMQQDLGKRRSRRNDARVERWLWERLPWTGWPWRKSAWWENLQRSDPVVESLLQYTKSRLCVLVSHESRLIFFQTVCFSNTGKNWKEHLKQKKTRLSPRCVCWVEV